MAGNKSKTGNENGMQGIILQCAHCQVCAVVRPFTHGVSFFCLCILPKAFSVPQKDTFLFISAKIVIFVRFLQIKFHFYDLYACVGRKSLAINMMCDYDSPIWGHRLQGTDYVLMSCDSATCPVLKKVYQQIDYLAGWRNFIGK